MRSRARRRRRRRKTDSLSLSLWVHRPLNQSVVLCAYVKATQKTPTHTRFAVSEITVSNQSTIQKTCPPITKTHTILAKPQPTYHFHSDPQNVAMKPRTPLTCQNRKPQHMRDRARARPTKQRNAMVIA